MLGKTIEPVDVYKIMIAMKMAREENSHKDDNLVDAIGYIAGLYDYHKAGKVEEPIKKETYGELQDPFAAVAMPSFLNVCLCRECCKDHVPFEKLEGTRVKLHYFNSRGDIAPFSSKDIGMAERRKVTEVIDFLDKTIECSKAENPADFIMGLQYARGEIRRHFLSDSK